MILTTLSDYAKQKGISRARAYQLQSKLSTIDLPVYAIEANGNKIPLYKDNQVVMQTYVQQDRKDVLQEKDILKMALDLTFDVSNIKRLKGRLEAIESILK